MRSLTDFHADNLCMPDACQWEVTEGAGEQEPRGTRDEAGNETSGQPQAMRADAPTDRPMSLTMQVCSVVHPQVFAEQVFGGCDECKRHVRVFLESDWLRRRDRRFTDAIDDLQAQVSRVEGLAAWRESLMKNDLEGKRIRAALAGVSVRELS